MLSVFVNLACAALAAAALAAHRRKVPAKILLRYFTVLSNLFCAAASLAVVIARLCGAVPAAVLVLKFAGTAAVAVTLLTVICFLGPFVYGYKLLLTGPDLWLHLICPVLAIVSLLLWDKPDAGFGVALLGVLPVVLYGSLYIYRVLLAPPGRRWDDFYGFNREGRWYVSLVLMLAAAFLISLILWLA